MRLRHKWSVEIRFTWKNEITDGRRMRWRYAKQQRGPLRLQRTVKNNVRINHDCNSEALQPRFSFFFLLNFTKPFQCWKSEPLPSGPSRPLSFSPSFFSFIEAFSPSLLSKAHLDGEAPSSMAYSLVDGAASYFFSFVFRCISMVENHH